MSRFIVMRLLSMIPTLLFISFIVFMSTYLIPGDPARLILGTDASEELVEETRVSLGLDKPVLERYAIWLGNVLQLDLGKSLYSRQPVTKLLQQAMPVTLQLTLYSTIVALIFSIVAAIIAVLRHKTVVDVVVSVGALAGLSTPEFWMAILLIFIVSVKLQWLPATGYAPLSEGLWENTRTLILPTLTLSLVLGAELMRYLRSGMLRVLTEDYVATDQAKGVPRRQIMTRTVFKNASIPFLTVLGLSLARLVGGAIVVETVFALPGMGRLGLHAVLNRDYVVMQAMVLFFALSFLIANLLVDLLYAYIDPRVRYAYRGDSR